MFTVSFLPQVGPIVNLWKGVYFLEVATGDTISPELRFTLDTYYKDDFLLSVEKYT